MALVIQDLGPAICTDVQPASEEIALDWSTWRQDYIGLEGLVTICSSEKKCPGKQFLCFCSGKGAEKDWGLRTGYGQLSVEGTKITFITQRSCYVFLLKEVEVDCGPPEGDEV